MSRVIEAFAQFFDGEGDPLVLGWLEFLASGTTSTQKNTYSDADLTIPNANPLQLDAEGRCPNAFGHGVYKVKLYSHDPVTGLPNELIQEFDPVVADYAITGSGDNFEEWLYDTTYEVGQIVTYQNEYFKSILSNNTGNTPSSTSNYWEKIDFVHYYNPNYTYSLDDVAVYSGAIYFSLQNNNLGNTPLTSPTWWTPVGSGTILLNWEENGTTFRPKVAGYDLGDTVNLLGDIYLSDGASLYLGAGQDLNITHDGVSGLIDNTVGDLDIKASGAYDIHFWTNATKRWSVDVNGNFIPTGVHNVGAPGSEVTGFYTSDAGGVYLGSDQDMSIIHNGTYARIDCGTGYLQIDSADDIDIQTAGIIRWIIDHSAGGDLRPATDNTRNIGAAAYGLKGIYFTDGGKAYFGSDQDLEIHHSAGNSFIEETLGNLYIGPYNATGHLTLVSNSTSRWRVDSSGHLFPVTGSAYNIGSTTNEIASLYIGSGGAGHKLFLGTTQAFEIYASGGAYMEISGSAMYAGTTSAHDLYFKTNNTNRWRITSTGSLLPQAANSYIIGGAANEVGAIYVGSSGLYIGTTQHLQITNDGSNTLIYSLADPIIFETSSTNDINFKINGTIQMYLDISVPRLMFNTGVKLQNAFTYNNPESGRNVVVDSNGNFGTVEASLRKLKDNILPIENTSWLYDIDVVSYTMKKDYNQGEEYGIIAEDLEEINPAICEYDYEWEEDKGNKKDKDGDKLKIKKTNSAKLYGVQYRKVYMAMLKEIQNLNQRIITLEGA